jgi:predicted RNase H-like HicB family nuclease
MRYSVILIRGPVGWSASVPAMPGCFSQGANREEGLAKIREAMELWLESEAAAGRKPLENTPRVVADGVVEALEILNEMREAGEIPPNSGDELELTTVELRQQAVV